MAIPSDDFISSPLSHLRFSLRARRPSRVSRATPAAKYSRPREIPLDYFLLACTHRGSPCGRDASSLAMRRER